jgi:hypothetical protein
MYSGVSLNCSMSLEYWRPYNIANGKVNMAKVQYLLHVETRYFKLMTANKNLIPYLKDNSKGRSIGSLAVFVDQGIVKELPPILHPLQLLPLLLNCWILKIARMCHPLIGVVLIPIHATLHSGTLKPTIQSLFQQ